ncbi:hypothetical protein BV898_13628 [Hypsibius exemplaris]|uniref:Uncharacterized protein n=1 Tax=Hypsibius exemplaris TaxID=2072580 RepID=A0A1W0WA76_HYPEX|nr:hypothetical protein BV898_13628 [Hypsibius exemplaris]
MPIPSNNNQYCAYNSGGRCSTAREPSLPQAYKMNEPARIPRRIGPDGFPVFRTEQPQPYTPKYVQFADAATGSNASDPNRTQTGFPPRSLPADVSNYYHSGPMVYGQGFGPTGGNIPPTVCPPVTSKDLTRMKDSGVKPWSAHPPDPAMMKERMRKYRNDHKISGFAGFFPGTHNMLGGSIYRIVTLEQEAEQKPFGGRV